MGIGLTVEQVVALAPDAASASAGKKLASPRTWQHLGCSDAALWGECQGSALYQVRVDLANYGVLCSCPSHKFPCKHGLGLLLLAVQSPTEIQASDPPEWVTAWLAKRTATATKKQEKVEKAAAEPINPAQQEKRAAQRSASVDHGLNALDLWMRDLVRAGLATVEHESTQIWEQQAKRLVDAKAPGVAALMRQMGDIPGASSDWPHRLLDRLGRVALLIQAYRHLESLDPAVQEDVRQTIGWTLSQTEVMARGEAIEDDWALVGQVIEEDPSHPNMLVQRTWLHGLVSGRPAMILQFSVMNTPYPETIIPDGRVQGTLRFWPGAMPLRAIIESRRGEAPIMPLLPGAPDVATFLHQMALALTQNPWQREHLCLLQDVVPCCEENGAHWWVQDTRGDALPLVDGNHWKMLGLSGGNPVTLAAEWDGERLCPLGVQCDGNYHLLTGEK